jgi:hypothetical protein
MNEDEIISGLNKAGVQTHLEGNRAEIEFSDREESLLLGGNCFSFRLHRWAPAASKPISPFQIGPF